MELRYKQRRHDTIFGYIREALFTKNIPKEIILICVLFYGYEMDYFKHYTKVQWSSSNNGKTIIKSEDGNHTVYASNVIKCDTNMVYKWTVKIDEMNSYIGCVIGIDEANYTHKQTWFSEANDGSLHYGYSSVTGNKWDSNGEPSD